MYATINFKQLVLGDIMGFFGSNSNGRRPWQWILRKLMFVWKFIMCHEIWEHTGVYVVHHISFRVTPLMRSIWLTKEGEGLLERSVKSRRSRTPGEILFGPLQGDYSKGWGEATRKGRRGTRKDLWCIGCMELVHTLNTLNAIKSCLVQLPNTLSLYLACGSN